MALQTTKQKQETALGAVFCLVGAGFAWGALDIQGEAGYGGVGPNFLPWVVAVALLLCGALLVLQGCTKGYSHRDEPEGATRGDWRSFGWISAGIVANALLIQQAGFVLGCTLCFVLAARGLRLSLGAGASPTAMHWLRTVAQDAGIGLCISLPVFWLFGHLLGISLPSLTGTFWL